MSDNTRYENAAKLAEKYIKNLNINNDEVFTVEKMYKFLELLIKDGKQDYILTCEGGCVGLGKPMIWEEYKEIEF